MILLETINTPFPVWCSVSGFGDVATCAFTTSKMKKLCFVD